MYNVFYSSAEAFQSFKKQPSGSHNDWDNLCLWLKLNYKAVGVGLERYGHLVGGVKISLSCTIF